LINLQKLIKINTLISIFVVNQNSTTGCGHLSQTKRNWRSDDDAVHISQSADC